MEWMDFATGYSRYVAVSCPESLAAGEGGAGSRSILPLQNV